MIPLPISFVSTSWHGVTLRVLPSLHGFRPTAHGQWKCIRWWWELGARQGMQERVILVHVKDKEIDTGRVDVDDLADDACLFHVPHRVYLTNEVSYGLYVYVYIQLKDCLQALLEVFWRKEYKLARVCGRACCCCCCCGCCCLHEDYVMIK